MNNQMNIGTVLFWRKQSFFQQHFEEQDFIVICQSINYKYIICKTMYIKEEPDPDNI